MVVSRNFTLAFGAGFTRQIRGLGLSQCHCTLTPVTAGYRERFPAEGLARFVFGSDSRSSNFPFTYL